MNALTMERLHEAIDEAIREDVCRVIGSQNLHSVYVARRDAKMREFYGRVHFRRIDGMPLVLWGRVLGYPLSRSHRVTWVDWLRPLMREAEERGWRVFYLGSQPDIVAAGVDQLRCEFPTLPIEYAHGYFNTEARSPENLRVIERINTFRPHILMVGMGMPRQEHWILENLEALQTNVILPCGACIDYVGGAIPTPPRWMGRLGLEWLYRLASEPKRLGSRYLIEPWYLLPLFARDFARRLRAP